MIQAPNTTMRRSVLAGGLGLLAGAHAARAAFPERPITLLVPFPPGGIVDTVARAVSERMGPHLGQPMVAENRPGGGSSIANQAVARAAPDGHTLLFCTTSLSILPTLNPSLEPRDPLRAFEAVGPTYFSPLVLEVSPRLPVTNVAEFVAWARTRGPSLNVATTGIGASPHLLWEMFQRRAGLPVGAMVHYRGGAPAALDLGAGRADVLFAASLEAIQTRESGLTRPLAVTSGARLEAMPDVPTLVESGYPDFDIITWGGLLAPAGTPSAVIARLALALDAALADPALRARFAALGVTPGEGGPARMRKVLADDIARYGNVIREAGIRPET